MSKNTMILAAALAVVSSGAMAQEFTGGELGVEYNTFIDGIDLDGTSYYAAVEIGIGQQFGFALDANQVDVGDSTSDARFTAHAIYHLGATSSVGLFYAQSPSADVDNAGFGLEGGVAFMGGDVGGYIGSQEVGSEDVFILGLDSNTPVSENFIVFSDFDIVADNDVGASTSELGLIYEIDNGPELYAQVGRFTVRADGDSASETYIGVGARITFGAARGTTFEGR